MKRIGFEDLVEKTAVTAVVSKEQARKVIKAYLEEIKLALCKGDAVALREFGTFNPVHRAKRNGIIQPQENQSLSRRKTL